MKVRALELPGVLLIEPRAFGDERGYFLETWHDQRYSALGIPEAFVQDNVSRSTEGTLRGLHLQHPNGQGKLVQALLGEVYDVAVDVRVGSPTYGRWVGAVLNDTNHHQLYVPAGFAHGFVVRSEVAIFSYKCTGPYDKESELGVAWDDPELAIAWGTAAPRLSEKDRAHPRLQDIARSRLPPFVAVERA
ncbi:MAG: dTDP-4-dehydrorhamnose 3,5-epimerase [Myxococcales bacterium]|nr:dTDP-4-dehydrorhamnose 3,5-epimerase [Myxococcales bacterium]